MLFLSNFVYTGMIFKTLLYSQLGFTTAKVEGKCSISGESESKQPRAKKEFTRVFCPCSKVRVVCNLQTTNDPSVLYVVLVL